MPRILIAEDNIANILLIRDLCKDMNFEPTVVEDGRAVVEAVRSSPPDLILMDIHTPLFDGLATTIELRSLQNTNEQMMIIGLNGNSSAMSAACRIAGMNQILTTPLQPERLMAALRSVQAPLNLQANVPEPEQQSAYSESNEAVMQRMAEAFGPMPVETPFARIYFANFQKLQGLFGDAWPGISAHIETITRAVIEQHISENAVYKRFEELDFVLMAPGQTEAACALWCKSIAREICHSLAADESGAKFHVRKVVFFGKAPTQEAETTEPSARVNPVSLTNPDILPWTRLNFWPVWDTQRRKFPIHAIRADRDTEGTLLAEASEALQLGGQDNYFAAIDISTIADLAGRLDGYDTLEQPRLLGLPLHFQTLGNFIGRSRFLYYLEQLPKRIRERLVIEIHAMPDEIRIAQIAEYQKPILAHCLHTMIVVSPLYRNFNVLKQVSNQIVGVELSEAEPEVEQELAALKQFGTLAKQSGLTMAASLVRDRAFRDWGLTSCRYVSGPAIALAQMNLCAGAKLID
jgi:CheY-like chemotaxis protein